jgi:hypothetical protein
MHGCLLPISTASLKPLAIYFHFLPVTDLLHCTMHVEPPQRPLATLYYVCTLCKRRQRERGNGTYVVHGAETPVADLSLVDEDGLRVIVKDVLGQLRVLTDDNFRSLPSYRHGWLAMNSRYFSRGEERGGRGGRWGRVV